MTYRKGFDWMYVTFLILGLFPKAQVSCKIWIVFELHDANPSLQP